MRCISIKKRKKRGENYPAEQSIPSQSFQPRSPVHSGSNRSERSNWGLCPILSDDPQRRNIQRSSHSGTQNNRTHVPKPDTRRSGCPAILLVRPRIRNQSRQPDFCQFENTDASNGFWRIPFLARLARDLFFDRPERRSDYSAFHESQNRGPFRSVEPICQHCLPVTRITILWSNTNDKIITTSNTPITIHPISLPAKRLIKVGCTFKVSSCWPARTFAVGFPSW